jgi:predicted lipoprotein with Yx(FWY)xxD motif
MTRSRPITILAGAAAVVMSALATVGCGGGAYGDSAGTTPAPPASAQSATIGAANAAGKPTVGGGADAALLGTTTRSDGEQQVSYNDHPLYLYAGDENAGDTRGQGLTDYGAGWYVLTPAGQQVSDQSANSYPSGADRGGS